MADGGQRGAKHRGNLHYTRMGPPHSLAVSEDGDVSGGDVSRLHCIYIYVNPYCLLFTWSIYAMKSFRY